MIWREKQRPIKKQPEFDKLLLVIKLESSSNHRQFAQKDRYPRLSGRKLNFRDLWPIVGIPWGKRVRIFERDTHKKDPKWKKCASPSVFFSSPALTPHTHALTMDLHPPLILHHGVLDAQIARPADEVAALVHGGRGEHQGGQTHVAVGRRGEGDAVVDLQADERGDEGVRGCTEAARVTHLFARDPPGDGRERPGAHRLASDFVALAGGQRLPGVQDADLSGADCKSKEFASLQILTCHTQPFNANSPIHARMNDEQPVV